jgi:hypothetical protein
MSKKKNTLKDLDEFLRQQAATLVTPDKLTGKPESPVKQTPETAQEGQPLLTQATVESIIASIRTLSSEPDFRIKLSDIILGSVSSLGNHLTPEDKMLINTALYLKHGENWKEAIREYWRNFDR